MNQDVKALLTELREKKIKIVLDGDNLEIASYDTELSDNIIEEIKTNKESLIQYLYSLEGDESTLIPVSEKLRNYPLSASQRRLWILSQSENATTAYNMSSNIELNGTYDIEKFKQAIYAVIDRHEILRTVFREDENGEVKQWVLSKEELQIAIDYKDYREVENSELQIKSYIEEDTYKPFDLVNGPLLRASLLRSSDNSYTFYYNMHHIISDGWSMDVLAKNVMIFYNAFVDNKSPEIEPLRIQYKDFSIWQSDSVNKENYKQHRDYWLTELSGDLPILNLPSKKVRPKFKTYNGRNLTMDISPDITSTLKSFCKKQGGSFYMGLLATLNVLLHKYSSEEDIVIGTAVSGRDHADLQDQIGFYVNTLAIRNQISSEESFLSFFQKVKETTMQGFKHQSYTFDKLVTDLNYVTDGSRSPIYDVMLTFQNIGDTNEGLEINNKEYNVCTDLGKCQSKFDIDITINESDGGLCLDLRYNEDVYDGELMKQLMKHYAQLVPALIDNSEKNIGNINFLTNTECAELLLEFNNTKFNYSENKTIVDVFRDQVKNTPDDVAVISGSNELTFRELDILSNQLSHCLVDRYDVKKNDLVGIQLERNNWIAVSILGILKSGAAYVPINSELPEAGKKHIVDDTNLKLLITETSYMFELDFYKENVFAVDVEFEASDFDEKPIELSISSNDLAYVIYTSGSTGKPKGVLIEHKSVINLIAYQTGFFDVNKDDRFLLFSNISFDASIEQLFLSLLNGARLYIPEKSDLLDMEKFEEILKGSKITHLHAVPSFLRNVPKISDSSLKRIVSGGDSFDDKITEEWGSNVQFFNEYGPTETTVTSIEQVVNSKSVSSTVIGKPLGNTNCYILNKQGVLHPKGVVGEICIGGEGVARGYLNRPKLTNKKFMVNPYNEKERLYKTGDLGRWLPDGTIEFIGRYDNQVKVRGYRIELGEIEYHLTCKDDIDQVVVQIKEIAGGGKDLVAYVVSEKQQSDKNLRKFLSARLPDYMLPMHYIQVEKMPLTTNGKIDRKSLLDLDMLEKSHAVAYKEPSTIEEQELVLVLENVLKREKISVKDSFYTLGGDSIKSIQVVSRLKQRGFSIKVDEILRTPIIENLAKLLVKHDNFIDQSEVTGEVKLTPIQHSFNKDSNVRVPHYFNQSILLKSSEEIKSDILTKCISKLVTHHDALRIVFNNQEGKLTQYNQDSSKNHYKIDFYDLRESKDPLQEMNELGGHIQGSIDLEKGPLFRIGHFRLLDGDRLALIVHHLVVDGVSWRILLEDLSTLYSSYISGEVPILPMKTDSFQRWADLQEEYAQGVVIDSERTYWNSICEQSILDIPRDIKMSESVVQFDDIRSFTLSKETTEFLQTKVHNVYNTGINDVLLTGLGLAIQEVFGVEKSVIQMEGHGREDIIEGIDISRTVGWFTSIYPFLLDVSGSENQRESLINVKEKLRKIPNKGIGYGILKHLTEGLEKEIKPSIVFNYLGDFGSNAGGDSDSVFDYSSEDIGFSIDPSNGHDTILDVSGMMTSSQLSMSIRYSTSIYFAETMDRLIGSYQKHLTRLIEDLAREKECFITPADLTFKGFTSKELSKLNIDNNIEDVYALSPLQQGIYYHWLSNTSTSMYFEQMSYRLQSNNLNIDSVKKAYDLLVSRHAILRSSFRNNYGGLPLQIVHKSVASNFIYEKIAKEFKEGEILGYLNAIKERDRKKGFDLESPSQMRLQVLELEDNVYEFIWSHHHVLMDGWCTSIVINDFYQLLNAIDNNMDPMLEDPIPYSNYIKWLDGIDRNKSLGYWKNYLSDYTQVAEVPFQVTKNDSDAYSEVKNQLEIKEETFEKIKSLCNNLAITSSTFYQAVWGYLVARYNDTNDVVFGAVVSGRPGDLSGVENMIGLFSNAIPVRVRYEKEDRPIDLLKRLNDKGISGSDHHYLNLSEVQSQSEIGMGLINHIMVFENFPIEERLADNGIGEDTELMVQSVEVIDQSNYDFNITIAPDTGSTKIIFRYNEEKYDVEGIEKLVNHYSYLIEQFCNKSDLLLSEFKYLSEEESNEILTKFNRNSEINIEKDATVLQLFKNQVLNTPNAKAIDFEGEIMTYKQLDVISNQLAHNLIQNYGIQSNDLVGVKLDRNEWMMISILGILKAGAAYVPINPSLPDTRKQFIVEDTSIKLLITDTNYIFDLGYFNGNILTLDAEFEPQEYSSLAVDLNIKHNDLAYIIYTSGSTGAPKGVMVEHSSLYTSTKFRNEYYKDVESYLLIPSFSFDSSVAVIWNALTLGATLNIVSEMTLKSPEKINNIIIENKVDSLLCVPSFYKFILNANNFKGDSLKRVIVAGEQLPEDLVINHYKKTKECVLFNEYGPTENTVWATVAIIDKVFDKISIGKPIKNTQVYIMDSKLQLVPVGVIGELYIGGHNLSRGYLNLPELTADKFIESPFMKGEKLYKTGDFVKWQKDGSIEFIGRKDDQLKIRGYRIELGEIEYYLRSKEDIVDTVVLARNNNNGDKELAAYIIAEKDQNVTDLRKFLQDKLPDYMIPKYFILVKEFPLTINGKIDKELLSSQEGKVLSTDISHQDPKTNKEKALVQLMKEILGLDKIGMNDSFFGLGGDSLNLIALISKLKQEGYDLDVVDLIENPIIKDFSKLIKEAS
ncbi:amino acid adenylation domain-containing protein [Aquimarina sp. M1]